jgi:hypothetical protein
MHLRRRLVTCGCAWRHLDRVEIVSYNYLRLKKKCALVVCVFSLTKIYSKYIKNVCIKLALLKSMF